MTLPTDSSPLPRPGLQPWVWTTFLAAVMAVALLRQTVAPPLPPLPVLGTVPAFRLVDEGGAPFTPERLAGRVWLADFIFTRCPSICPEMTDRLVRLRSQLGEQVELVSVSVDPAFDTPDRMRAFAEKHRALSPGWHFLTSDGRSTEDTVVRGFKIGLTRDGTDVTGITHGTHVVLVDGQGRIRGYYDSADPDALERLVTDARRLAPRS